MKKYLLKEIEFHLRMLNNGTIDKDDFVNAIHEVYDSPYSELFDELNILIDKIQ